MPEQKIHSADLAEENRRLRRTMRDLVALSTLPAVWFGLPLAGIAGGLAGVLLDTLSLELVYLRLESPQANSTEVIRVKHQEAIDPEHVRALLAEALASDGTSPPSEIPFFLGGGTLHLAVTRFGVGEEQGILVTGSRNPRFPTEQDRLLLGVGANQTAIVLRHRRAEDQTHDQRERLLVTLASIGDAVLTTDIDARVSFMNPVAQELTGWTLEAANGQPVSAVFDIVDQETRTPVDSPICTVLREGKITGLPSQSLLIAKDGTERPIDDSAAPIRDKSGQIVGCVLVFRDVSEKQRAEAQVRQAGEQAHTILESITDAFFALDHGWRFTYVNHQSEKVLERSKEDLLGKVLWDVYPSLAGSEFERTYRAAGEGVASSVTSYFPDHKRWYEVHAYPASHGVAVYFRDVTDQRQADARLREAEEQFRALADNIPQLSWMADPDGAVFWLNRRWYEYTGTRSDQMQGAGWQSVVCADELPRVVERFARSIASGEPWEDTFRLRRHDGELRWHLSRAMPIKDDHGRVLRWFGSNTDVTEQRAMAAELAEADRRKNEFLATLAHELRNPLAPIRTGLQLLKLSADDKTSAEQARSMMERQLGQMVRLVDDLMDVSRITSGKIELRREPVLLTDVVNSAIETTRPLMRGMGQQLTVVLPDEPVVVDADLTRLAQVFMNLLNNAAKYSDPGSTIQLSAKCDGSRVSVSVKDSGMGISAEHLPRVFDMFSQAERSLAKSQGGLGIGLTLVKRLVEMHGGTVEGSSEGPDRGSEFLVQLPIVTRPSRHPAGAQDARHSQPSSLRILVVDDNEDGADILAMMLRAMGNEVRSAYDGEEALALAAAPDFRPEVVLLDIGLPGLNGYDTCKHLRAQPGGKGLLIVAQTGWGQSEDRERSREAGFDHHMVKPIDPQALQRVLADFRARRSAEAVSCAQALPEAAPRL